ncbi:MAG TPA: serine hydrolase domain-containing protein [Polyangiaceae bacterium]|nr:serine hydrolase domain-containing protein [Polyangiaceae bacterium]
MVNLRRWLIAVASQRVVALAAVLSGVATLGGCAIGLSDPSPPVGPASVKQLEKYVRETIADSDPPSTSIAVSQGAKSVFLIPLQMARTHFYYEEAFAAGTVHAVGSHPNDFMAFVASFSLDLGVLSRRCSNQRWWFEYFSPDQTAPSGLISTSSDMVRFGQMIHNRGVLDDRRILSEASVARMTEAQVAVSSSPAPPGFWFGDSWFIKDDTRGRRMLMHGGQGMAFTSLLMIRPDDGLVAAIAANGTYLEGANGLDVLTLLTNIDWTGGT